MAYGGFLLKIGDYEVPHGMIKADSYKAYANMQDLDPYTDANGYVHRNAVELKALKIEFETKDMITNEIFAEFMSNISANYVSEKERSFIVTAYIPEYDDYVTQTAYLADFTPQIYSTYNNILRYRSMRMAIIGGVYSG